MPALQSATLFGGVFYETRMKRAGKDRILGAGIALKGTVKSWRVLWRHARISYVQYRSPQA